MGSKRIKEGLMRWQCLGNRRAGRGRRSLLTLPDGVLKGLCSSFTRSTPEPNISRSRHMMRVFFPAPDGP